ncbi:MAG: Pr6Pr family membrane protein [Candidatus Microsaccharimonas sp.]
MIFKYCIRLAIITSACIGLVIQTGVWSGHFKASSLIYLTILSAAFIAATYTVWLVVSLITTLRSTVNVREIPPTILGSMAVCVLVTGIIFAVVLAPSASLGRNETAIIGNILLHQIVPILVLIDWFVNQSNKNLRWYHPLLWTVLPTVYLVYLFMRLGYIPSLGIVSSFNGTVPYYFLNVDRFGWAYVLSWVLGIITAMVIAGYIMVIIKKITHKFFINRLKYEA